MTSILANLITGVLIGAAVLLALSVFIGFVLYPTFLILVIRRKR